jgi:hypothetical protein
MWCGLPTRRCKTSRKTVDVAWVREKVNHLLKNADVSDDYRRGAISVLESVLHHTDNYHGYNLLSWIEKEGRERSGVEQWRIDCAKEGVDLPTEPYLGNQTRREYYS